MVRWEMDCFNSFAMTREGGTVKVISMGGYAVSDNISLCSIVL